MYAVGEGDPVESSMSAAGEVLADVVLTVEAARENARGISADASLALVADEDGELLAVSADDADDAAGLWLAEHEAAEDLLDVDCEPELTGLTCLSGVLDGDADEARNLSDEAFARTASRQVVKNSRAKAKRVVGRTGRKDNHYRFSAAFNVDHKLLTPMGERRLLSRAQAGDPKARRDLIAKNVKLVLKEALKQHRWCTSLDVEDLVQEGIFGLMRAIDKFELERKTRFSTYAMWWVKQSIKRAREDTERTVRVPVHVQARLLKLWSAKERLRAETNREPSIAEVAEAAGETPEKAQALEEYRRDAVLVSLDAGTARQRASSETGEAAPLHELVAEEGVAEEGADGAASQDEVRMVREALTRLDPVSREIIERRYGLARGMGVRDMVDPALVPDPERARDIADSLNMTVERVRQRLQRTEKELKGHIALALLEQEARRGGDPFGDVNIGELLAESSFGCDAPEDAELSVEVLGESDVLVEEQAS